MPSRSGINLNTPPSKSKKSSNGSSSSSPDKKGLAESRSSGVVGPKSGTFIVRSAKTTSPKSAVKVYFSLDVLRSLNIFAGDLIYLRKSGGDVGVVGIATLHASGLAKDVIEITISLRRLIGIALGERVQVTKYSNNVEFATGITVWCSDDQYSGDSLTNLLCDIGPVCTGLTFDLAHGIECQIIDIQGLPNIQGLEIDDTQSDGDDGGLLNPIFYCQRSGTDIIQTTETKVKGNLPRTIGYSSIGGLQKQISLLRAKVELPLHQPALFKRFNMSPDRGFILHGPPGTGKTMLLQAVAQETNAHVLTINGPSIVSKYLGETEASLRSIFEEARIYQPSIIFIDEIDALVPKRDSDDSGEAESRLVSTLLTLMDGMGAMGRIVVIGATNRINSIDPALRRPGRFGQEIEIGIPDVEARLDILRLQLKEVPRKFEDDYIKILASRCHGYVGSDLYALCREAVLNAIQSGIVNRIREDEMFVTKEDFEHAMLEVRPSAMREIVLETPKTYWEDIGGQEEVKQRLKETVEWPILHPESFERLGVRAPRGILLYGPPGCSKTLIAKALATEVDLNFLAVKGPELFNKFVGESERAVREIFRKARAAAPSIIFFDEIDALSVARGHGEAGGDRVLTSLLNEMDGIESLNGVIVLAATNRPDVIDSALMRPGRLDRLIYVGPPEFKARKRIFAIQFKKMKVSSDINIDDLALLTEGCSGAEIVNACQEAGLLAMNQDINISEISFQHFKAAIVKLKKAITAEMIEYFETFAKQGII